MTICAKCGMDARVLFKFGNGSLLVFLGLEQSFAKWLSPQLSMSFGGLHLSISTLQSTMLCDLEFQIDHHMV